MSLVDDLMQHLGQGQISEISNQIGASPAQTQTAVQAALPLILGGMASTSQQPGGANEIEQAAGSHAGILGSLGGLLSGGALADGGGLLGRVLGEHRQTVNDGVSQASGLNSDQTRKLLLILAPVVLAVLARHRSQAAAQAQAGQPAQPESGSLQGTLQQAAEHAKQQADRSHPQIGGLLGKILQHVETPRS